MRNIFAAVFFVFFGHTTDPGQLPAVLLPALLLAIIGLSSAEHQIEGPDGEDAQFDD